MGSGEYFVVLTNQLVCSSYDRKQTCVSRARDSGDTRAMVLSALLKSVDADGHSLPAAAIEALCPGT
jgi:hypothetical protein